jgi:hypothetical protein
MVKIWLMETSHPIEVNNEENTYTKGNLYCVYTKENIVYKFPMDKIFMIEEPYSK